MVNTMRSPPPGDQEAKVGMVAEPQGTSYRRSLSWEFLCWRGQEKLPTWVPPSFPPSFNLPVDARPRVGDSVEIAQEGSCRTRPLFHSIIEANSLPHLPHPCPVPSSEPSYSPSLLLFWLFRGHLWTQELNSQHPPVLEVLWPRALL
jgi:hypothetical protein